MGVTVERKWDDVRATESLIDRSSRATLSFIVSGTPGSSEFDAREALLIWSPPTYGMLVREQIETLARVHDSADGVMWEAQVGYAHPDQREMPKPTDEETVVFEIRAGGSGTVQRTYSRELVEEVANLDGFKFDATDVEKILGLKAADADNGTSLNAQGVAVKQGQVQVIMHAWRSNATTTGGFLLNVCDACERQVVNSGPFKNFPGGSLQFTDFSAQQKAGTMTWNSQTGSFSAAFDAGWDFTFTFLFGRKVRPSVPGLPAFTKDKMPHEYLDVLFMPEKIPVKNVVVSKPVRAAIHQIYESENFYDLFKVK